MSIIEVVILIIVLTIAIWAILSTAASSNKIQTFSREDMGVRLMASSWFEIFESLDPKIANSNFNTAAQRVALILGGTYSSGYASVRDFKIKAEEIDNHDILATGRRIVRLTFKGAGNKDIFSIDKRVNAVSNQTVPDSKVP